MHSRRRTPVDAASPWTTRTMLSPGLAVEAVAVAFLGMGIAALASPRFITSFFSARPSQGPGGSAAADTASSSPTTRRRIAPLTAAGRNEVRAVYGGYGVAVALTLLYADIACAHYLGSEDWGGAVQSIVPTSALAEWLPGADAAAAALVLSRGIVLAHAVSLAGMGIGRLVSNVIDALGGKALPKDVWVYVFLMVEGGAHAMLMYVQAHLGAVESKGGLDGGADGGDGVAQGGSPEL